MRSQAIPPAIRDNLSRQELVAMFQALMKKKDDMGHRQGNMMTPVEFPAKVGRKLGKGKLAS